MKIVESNLADPTQFDPSSDYYDPKSPPDAPRWQTVRVEFVEEWAEIVSLDQLRDHFPPDDLVIVRRGNRLSVTPVDPSAAEKILDLATLKLRPSTVMPALPDLGSNPQDLR